MREIQQLSESEIDWSRLAPVLDRVMHELAEADRLALLLRYFEKRPFVEVGARLGLNENAARMRVDRALDRLRGHLADRGITSTASALALVLSGQAIIAAPAGLGQTVASAALAAVAISIPTFGFLSVMTSTKIKVSAIVVGCALLGTLVLVQQQKLQQLRAEQDALLKQLAEQSAALSNARELVDRKDAELAASRESLDELLRLRGEVSVLRQTARQASRSTKASPADRPPPPKQADAASGLSAGITAATNRVSTLNGLEFSVVITNSVLTNVTIHPWNLINGLGTVTMYDAEGLLMAYRPNPPTRIANSAEPPRDFILKPGESYALKYRLGDQFFKATPPGKYRARGLFMPSNEVEITIE
jgi:hypothetical protein